MLSEELLRQVRLLNLRSRRAVSDLFAGQYASAFKGRGMEFNEVRPYQPGDDVRDIDWNVTARTGEPFIKRFTEERELTVMLVADTSPSTEFGSVQRFKADTINELCAVLATAASLSNDRVGLLTFDHDVRTTVPPRKGRNHTALVLRTLIADEDASEHEDPRLGGPTDVAGALESVLTHLSRRAIIVLASDFLTPDLAGPRALDDEELRRSRLAAAIRRATRRHDLLIAHAVDPLEGLEGTARARGLVDVVDAETGRRRVVDLSSARVRRNILREAHEHRERVRQLANRSGADYIVPVNGRDYMPDLINLFRSRGHRR